MLPVLRVTSVALPTILHTCPRCPGREFICSKRFRLNANGKVADLWLIYRCAKCDATKNLTVVERTPVARIPAALFRAATENDAVTAARLARDVSVMRRNGVQLTRGDDFVVADAVEPAFRLEFPDPLLVRLDHVIARATRLSTSELNRRIQRGECRVDAAESLSRLRLRVHPVSVAMST